MCPAVESLSSSRNRKNMIANKIEDLFSDYSQQDLAKALFVISTWTKNRSADLKIKYAYACFLSGKNFSNEEIIKDYIEFSKFSDALFSLLPSFPSLEDFVPEGDWGEIKYFFKNRDYRMLYGSELSWAYDFLTNFEILYQSLDEEINAITNESPLGDLEEMLKLSDSIVGSLKHNPSSHTPNDISPGHIELPSEEYWIESERYLSSLEIQNYSKSFLNRFTSSAGDIALENRKLDSFVDAIYSGKLVRYMAISTPAGIFPVSPRWFVSALIDSWAETFDSIRTPLRAVKPPIPIRVGVDLGRFIKNRIRDDRVNVLVSATNVNEKPDDFIFPFTVQSGDSLYLFCFLSPFLDEDTEVVGYWWTLS